MIKRVLIAGSRNYDNYREAKKYIDFCISNIRLKYTLVFVSGNCRGADSLGEKYAAENSFNLELYPADWNRFGKRAGPLRNKYMVEISDYIICFWDGKSRGTKSVIDFAQIFHKPLKIKLI